MAFLRAHWFALLIAALCLVAVAGSVNRFLIAEAYVIEYEAPCNPRQTSCFTRCEDESCSVTRVFSRIQKVAHEVRMACGPDVTGCAAAATCQPGESFCRVIYCSESLLQEGESCKTLQEFPAQERTDETL